jgi:hypothetical protein
MRCTCNKFVLIQFAIFGLVPVCGQPAINLFAILGLVCGLPTVNLCQFRSLYWDWYAVYLQ